MASFSKSMLDFLATSLRLLSNVAPTAIVKIPRKMPIPILCRLVDPFFGSVHFLQSDRRDNHGGQIYPLHFQGGVIPLVVLINDLLSGIVTIDKGEKLTTLLQICLCILYVLVVYFVFLMNLD